MEIYFLTPEVAYSRLRGLHINHYGCTRPHTGNIITFNKSQQKRISKLMYYVQQLLPEPIGRVEFVLLNRGVYWDRPFTWDFNLIMLTPVILEQSDSILLKILIHEWVHLDQRRHPIKYDRLYHDMGFKRTKVDFGQYKHKLFSNPDAMDYEWIWRNKYIPFAIMDNCECRTLVMEQNTGIIYDVSEVPEYYNAFGHHSQLYHPNEIIAHKIEQTIKK